MTDIAALVERLRHAASHMHYRTPELLMEAAEALQACQAENNKLRLTGVGTAIAMTQRDHAIARAEKAEAEIKRLRADLVVIKQAFLEERAKRGKDAHEIERLRAAAPSRNNHD